MGPDDAGRLLARGAGSRAGRADAGAVAPVRPDVGALAVRAPSGSFHWDSRQAFSEIGSLANELIDQIDRQRIREVRARVDRKILEPSQPKNLAYELLHGIRSLTGYDHSAALLIYDSDLRSLEVVAEQIAWQKAKGQNVGRKLSLAMPLRELLDRPFVCGFNRAGKGWENWTGTDAMGLAELLDYLRGQARTARLPPEGAILCASLAARSGLLGILRSPPFTRARFAVTRSS